MTVTVLIKQKKTTVKPPFDPEPFTVTKTIGNQAHAEKADGTQRIRDKNKLKKICKRPEHLHTSWEKKITPITSDYANYDIEGIILRNTDVALSSRVEPIEPHAEAIEHADVTPPREV